MTLSLHHVSPTRGRRKLVGNLFRGLFLAATFAGVVLLVVLLVDVVRTGAGRLNPAFLTHYASRFPSIAGIRAALLGSVWLVGLTTLLSVPVGVGSAIYLEEYARKSRWNAFIEINMANLAGVPSIVYGILGLALFVRGMALGRSLIAGALTMSLVVLPVIIVAAREALRAVPTSLRHAAFALGATRWQTIRHHVLPAALPGILTGVILAISRAIGETAPLIMVGALTYVKFDPTSPTDAFTTLPIQVYDWASRPQKAFHELAAAAIIVLLAVLLTLNAAAIVIRHRFQRQRA